MLRLETMPTAVRRAVRYVLSDIDDTLTSRGRLEVEAFASLAALQTSGRKVVLVTGRPAGWCDHIARMWPVNGLVGENGAFYFSYDDEARGMTRRFVRSAEQRREDLLRLLSLSRSVIEKVPGCAVSSDQAYRSTDMAIDFREDVAPLPFEVACRIRDLFEAAGVCAKVSSIHVNAWFGDHDKLSTTRLLFREVFQEELDDVKDQVVYVGDSPNDAPMFDFFENSIGVANIMDFSGDIQTLPRYITRERGGKGFAELVPLFLEPMVGESSCSAVAESKKGRYA